MILFENQKYSYQSNDEFDPGNVKTEFYQSLSNKLESKQTTKNSVREHPKPVYISIPPEGRQVFTRWRWSYPNRMTLKSKTFYIKYEKPLSTVDKILLNNFRKKYLYHAMDDVLYFLKFKPIERDNLLSILYSPVISLQNNFSIDFFDIWIDEIYINKMLKSNKFLANQNSASEPFSYITIKLLYNNKLLPKKTESFW